VQDENDKNYTKDKEGKKMAAIKPNVFEIAVTQENYNEVRRKINEPRITKSFLNECINVAKSLRKEKTDK
jgi:hypothetical protein